MKSILLFFFFAFLAHFNILAQKTEDITVTTDQKINSKNLKSHTKKKIKSLIGVNQQNKATISTSSNQIKNNASDESIMFDFASMPKEVQHKISLNKQARRHLSDGVIKIYTIKSDLFLSESKVKKTFDSIRENKSILKIEKQSPDIIQVYVSPSTGSTDLKQIFRNYFDHFDFLTEQFQIQEDR